MALKEISALNSLATVTDTTFLHVKHGGVDYKIVPQTLFDLYNLQTPGNDDNRAVTKAEVGLGTVSDDPQLKIASNLSDVASVSAARTSLSVDSSAEVTIKVDAHADLTNDPHNVTKTQVGLGSVPNYPATSTITDPSTSKFATINAVSQVNAKVNTLALSIIPAGAVIMWSTLAAIPAGWLAMDGTNGTIDMRGSFVRGGGLAPGADQVGTTGGADTVTNTLSISIAETKLTEDQVPNHIHWSGSGTQYTQQYGEKGTSFVENWGGGNKSLAQTQTSPAIDNTGIVGDPSAEGHVHTGTITHFPNAGDNLPSYYTLIYIIKT